LDRELLAESIQKRIKKAGYETIEKFCFENEIPKSTFSEFLSGKYDPKLSTLEKISEALGTSVSQLLKQ